MQVKTVVSWLRPRKFNSANEIISAKTSTFAIFEEHKKETSSKLFFIFSPVMVHTGVLRVAFCASRPLTLDAKRRISRIKAVSVKACTSSECSKCFLCLCGRCTVYVVEMNSKLQNKNKKKHECICMLCVCMLTS